MQAVHRLDELGKRPLEALHCLIIHPAHWCAGARVPALGVPQRRHDAIRLLNVFRCHPCIATRSLTPKNSARLGRRATSAATGRSAHLACSTFTSSASASATLHAFIRQHSLVERCNLLAELAPSEHEGVEIDIREDDGRKL